MASINLKGREVPLLYTTWEMKLIQEEIAKLEDFRYIVFGRNKDDEGDDSLYGSPQQLDAIAKMIRILGNAGLEEAGEEPDLTDKKVLRALKPIELADALKACSEAMAEGMASEYEPEKQEGPVDVTLEEMNRKKKREN